MKQYRITFPFNAQQNVNEYHYSGSSAEFSEDLDKSILILHATNCSYMKRLAEMAINSFFSVFSIKDNEL